MNLRFNSSGMTFLRPSFSKLQRLLSGTVVSQIWCDNEMSPDDLRLSICRPSTNLPVEEGGRGPGGATLHQASVQFFSTPDNVVLLRADTDLTFVEWLRRNGRLHAVRFVSSIDDIYEAVNQEEKTFLTTDSFGSRFDPWSSISTEDFQLLSQKSTLGEIVSKEAAPVERTINCFSQEIDADAIDEISGCGRFDVLLKTNNGGNASKGVWTVSATEVTSMLKYAQSVARRIKERFAQVNQQILSEYGKSRRLLDGTIIIQRVERGACRKAHFFIDKNDQENVVLLGFTEQVTEIIATTRRGSRVLSLDKAYDEKCFAELAEHISLLRAKYPNYHGFYYCDYIAGEDRTTIFDPGPRPSFSTGAVISYLRLIDEGFPEDVSVISDFDVHQSKEHSPWSKVSPKLESLLIDFENMKSPAGYQGGIIPIGWNPILGAGRFICVGLCPSHEEKIEEDLQNCLLA